MLYERYYGYALKIVFRYIYHYDEAVDVVNDGFIKLFKKIQTFETSTEAYEKVFLGWLKRIMINTAIDELRKPGIITETGDMPESIWDQQDISMGADQLLLYKELINHVKKLPPSYRIVFNMFVIDGYSHNEIAKILDISAGTSKSSLFKARMHLQKYINNNLPETGTCSI